MGRAARGDGDWNMAAAAGCWAACAPVKPAERPRWATAHWAASCGVGPARPGNGNGATRCAGGGVAAPEAGEGGKRGAHRWRGWARRKAAARDGAELGEDSSGSAVARGTSAVKRRRSSERRRRKGGGAGRLEASPSCRGGELWGRWHRRGGRAWGRRPGGRWSWAHQYAKVYNNHFAVSDSQWYVSCLSSGY
jgi:hypothetical protein